MTNLSLSLFYARLRSAFRVIAAIVKVATTGGVDSVVHALLANGALARCGLRRGRRIARILHRRCDIARRRGVDRSGRRRVVRHLLGRFGKSGGQVLQTPRRTLLSCVLLILVS